MNKRRAMIIAPFDAAGQRVRDTISRVLQELGVEVFRIDGLKAGSNITYEITSAIESSDFVIVDVSRQNPNVMYELGFAHALRKPTLLVSSQESAAAMPTDLASTLYIVYDPDNLSTLRDTFKRVVHHLVRT